MWRWWRRTVFIHVWQGCNSLLEATLPEIGATGLALFGWLHAKLAVTAIISHPICKNNCKARLIGPLKRTSHGIRVGSRPDCN